MSAFVTHDLSRPLAVMLEGQKWDAIKLYIFVQKVRNAAKLILRRLLQRLGHLQEVGNVHLDKYFTTLAGLISDGLNGCVVKVRFGVFSHQP